MDIIEQAIEVVAEQYCQTVTWRHETDCKVRRAQTSPFARADLGHWGAVITDEDVRHGFSRIFLPRTYKVAWSKHAAPRLDFSKVAPGQLLQLHGYVSRSSQEDRFYRVISIDDSGVTMDVLTAGEMLSIVRGGLA